MTGIEDNCRFLLGSWVNGDAIHAIRENQEEQILAGVGRSECVSSLLHCKLDPSYVNRQIDL